MERLPCVSFDTETHLIECGKLTPPMVCISASAGQEKMLISSADGDANVLSLWETILEAECIIAHNAAFDLGVMAARYPHTLPLIFKALREGRVHDTLIREKLLNVCTHGKLDFVEFRGVTSKLDFSLASLARSYLGVDLTSAKGDEDAWRLNYIHLEKIPSAAWPSDAVTYAVNDSVYTEQIFRLQEDKRALVSKEIGADPFQTEGFQVQAAFCLFLMTVRGMEVDPVEVDRIAAEVAESRHISKMPRLIQHGILIPAIPPRPYANGALNSDGTPKMVAEVKEKISQSALRSYIERLAAINPEVKLKRTDPSDKFPEGQTSIDSEFIEDNYHLDPVLEEYRDRQELEKLHTTYIPALKYREGPLAGQTSTLVHGNYDPIKETYRTSSYASKNYPSFNVQNQDPRIRSAIVAREGMVICSTDYGSLELCTLAQTLLNIFGRSRHADIINAGICPHEFLGAQIAKASDDTFKSMAAGVHDTMAIYEIFHTLKKHENEAAQKFWKHYRTFAKPTGLGYPGGLGPATFMQFAKTTYGTIVDLDTAKKLRDIWMATFPEMDPYFKHIKTDCKDFRNGPKIIKVFRDGVKVEEKRDVYFYRTPFGGMRSGCDFCAAANGKAMQSPAADGAKKAVVDVVEDCYGGQLTGVAYPMAFIHDEILTEIDFSDRRRAHAAALRISELMVAAMRLVCPNVKIKAEPCFMAKWNKKAEAVYDADGVLKIWEP